MLPNKMKISEQATNSLRKLQSKTGLTPNVGARLAFLISFERGYRYDETKAQVEHTGRELDKHTWLGDYASITEMLLEHAYSKGTRQFHHNAWAAHIDDGANLVESKTSLSSIADFKILK